LLLSGGREGPDYSPRRLSSEVEAADAAAAGRAGAALSNPGADADASVDGDAATVAMLAARTDAALSFVFICGAPSFAAGGVSP